MVVALAVVLFGYLVPHLARSRQQLADSRVEDRYSGTMRVVTTGTGAKRTSSSEHHAAPTARPYLHDPRRRTENPAVNRPTSHAERSAADARRLAALRAARAAEISRRQAAARRRLTITLVLLAASIAGWVGFGLGAAGIALGIVPTVLLGGVLVLGRRAAKAAARRNAADRAAIARLQLTPAPRGDVAARRAAASAVAGRGVAVSVRRDVADTGAVVTGAADETATAQVAAEVVEAADQATPAEVPETAAQPAGEPWTPVPVPVPSYALKPTAPRRDIAGYQPEEPAAVEATEAAADIESSPYGQEPATAVVEELPEQPAALAAGTGIDLDSVLARRRAVGA